MHKWPESQTKFVSGLEMRGGDYLEIREFKSWNQRSGAEKGFYKGLPKIGNNISAATVLKCSTQNQAVCMKLNIFFTFIVFLRKTKSHFIVAITLDQNGTTGQGNELCVLG